MAEAQRKFRAPYPLDQAYGNLRRSSFAD